MLVSALDPALLVYQEEHWRTREQHFLSRIKALEVWPESHWPGFALHKADVFQCDMAW